MADDSQVKRKPGRPFGIHTPHGSEAATTRSLKTLASLKNELASVIKALKAKTIDEKIGRALVYAISTQAEIVKAADIEPALRALQEKMCVNADDTGDASVLELPASPDDPPTSQ